MEMLPARTVITCSRKNHRIGVLKEPVAIGAPLKLSSVQFTLGQERVQGEKFECTVCGALYAKGGMVHTQGHVWKPETPPGLEKMKKPREMKATKLKLDPDRPEAKQAKILKKIRDKKEKDKQANLRSRRS